MCRVTSNVFQICSIAKAVQAHPYFYLNCQDDSERKHLMNGCLNAYVNVLISVATWFMQINV